ncbi:MAG: hypothetical protein QM774_01385 [Gordonia sp. (in: high G+C Gram-positive bacteria)]|uniref:hypothetical protein n=1 Tax=Gordonia sp. (in: high G+C Gram-positive bacteria) TaxID=84139 RepID=UPI0039E5D0DA
MSPNRMRKLLLTAGAGAAVVAIAVGSGPAAAATRATITEPRNDYTLPYLDSVRATVDVDAAAGHLRVTIAHRGIRPPQEIGWRYYTEGVVLRSGASDSSPGIQLSYGRQPMNGKTSQALVDGPNGQVRVPVNVVENGSSTTYTVNSAALKTLNPHYLSGWTSDGILGLPALSDTMPRKRF